MHKAASYQPRRQVIKGARWLLLRNRENVPSADRVKLRELLQANRRLCTIYIFKEDLKEIWKYRYPKPAMRAFAEWHGRVAQISSFFKMI